MLPAPLLLVFFLVRLRAIVESDLVVQRPPDGSRRKYWLLLFNGDRSHTGDLQT